MAIIKKALQIREKKQAALERFRSAVSDLNSFVEGGGACRMLFCMVMLCWSNNGRAALLMLCPHTPYPAIATPATGFCQPRPTSAVPLIICGTLKEFNP